MTFFGLLPPEINTQLLLNIPASQAYELCQQPELEGLCDWSYWRNKALIDFQIPRSYFDLALDREIPGDYRYLEISTRFVPSLNSLASINNGSVSGIYEPGALLNLAFDRNQPDLFQVLLPTLSKQFLEEFYGEKIATGFIPNDYTTYGRNPIPPKESLIGHSTIYNLLALAVGGKVFKNLPKFYYDLEARDWDSIDQEFSTIDDEFDQVQVILNMIYSQDNQAWVIAQKYIPNYNDDLQQFFLRAALECGNKPQVDWILQYLPNVKTQPNQFYSDKFKVGQYFGAYDRVGNFQFGYRNIRYSFILDAYCGANMELIQQFESYGYTIDINKLQNRVNPAVITGYKYGLSNPLAVYDLISQLAGKGVYLSPGFGDIDIDNLLLQNPRTLDQFRNILTNLIPNIGGTLGSDYGPEGNYYSQISYVWDRGNIGNVDSLNWILGQYYNIPGAAEVIREKLVGFSPWYPLSKIILESYLKISK